MPIPKYPNPKALERYNGVMESVEGQQAYRQLNAYSKAFHTDGEHNEFMNTVIDAALDRCGDLFYRGGVIRAVMMSPSHHVDEALNRYLLKFGGES